MKIITQLLIVIILFAFHGTAIAQSECEGVLQEANTLYKNGQVLETIEKLNACMASFNSEDERFEAHRLLALSYFGNKDLEHMHEAIKLMLQERPDYISYSIGNDPTDFSKILQGYDVRPSLWLGFSAGVSSNSVRVIENKLPYDNVNSFYQGSLGYYGGVSLEWAWKRNLSITGSAFANGSTIDHHIEGIEQKDQNYKESYNMANLSLGLRYSRTLGRAWTASAILNIGAAFLFNDNMLVTFEDRESGEIEQFSADGVDNRNRLQPFAGIGLAIERQLFVGSLSLGIIHNRHLSTMIPQDQLLDNLEFAFQSLYFNDLLKVNYTMLQLSYKFPINYTILTNLTR